MFCDFSFHFKVKMKLSIVLFVALKLMSARAVVLQCSFSVSSENIYTCTNHNLVITKNAVEVKSVSGDHADGLNNDNVLSVYFLSSGMRNLPRGVFKVFKNLSKYVVSGLDMYDAYLNSSALVKGDFTGGKSLQALLFISVIIENLRAKVFEGANNLVHMTLEACRITSIDKDAFFGLKKLQSLGLKFNYIAALNPNTFSSLVELRHLLLSGNYLHKFSKAHVKGLKKLQRISVIGNLLEEIDLNITSLPNLEQLYLDQNLCINEHFGTDGIPFTKFKNYAAQCSQAKSMRGTMSRSLNEMKELETEIASLQKMVEKYRHSKCEEKNGTRRDGIVEGEEVEF